MFLPWNIPNATPVLAAYLAAADDAVETAQQKFEKKCNWFSIASLTRAVIDGHGKIGCP